MKNYFVTFVIACALIASFFIIRQKSNAQNANSSDDANATTARPIRIKSLDSVNQQSSPVYLTEIPPAYRDWKLISVAREEGKLDDIRAILGNDIAIQAYREGKRPFPEGTIIARLAWSLLPSNDNNEIFGATQSFMAGPPKNGVQFMIKDSNKYAVTGGWGYGQFEEGKFVGLSMLKSCFPCHQAFKEQDFVFTHYAP